MRKVTTEGAPEAMGPYSQGLIDGDRIFVSGQGPVSPESGEVESNDVADQTAQTLDNVAAILEAADASLDDVVKTTVFLTDMGDYDSMNDVYAEYMSQPYPTRSAIGVADLPIDIKVEIEVIAGRNG